MTVASEIARLQGVKTNILNAIAAKGVSVSSGAKLADCPNLISSISGGGSFDISDIVPIIPARSMYIIDDNGYIGNDVTKYFGCADVLSKYYYSFAILAKGSDFSQSGLGQVTITQQSTDYIGGRLYRTVTIDGVKWLAENLDFKFSGLCVGDNRSIAYPQANYYINREDIYGVSGNKYGLLYNYYAVQYLEDNKSLLIPGWHVPTATEWDNLINYAGGSSVAGEVLKSSTGWNSGNGTDSLNFTAFPCGFCNFSYNPNYQQLGTNAYFWTSSLDTSTTAKTRYMRLASDVVSASFDFNLLFSVRLVKDSQ